MTSKSFFLVLLSSMLVTPEESSRSRRKKETDKTQDPQDVQGIYPSNHTIHLPVVSYFRLPILLEFSNNIGISSDYSYARIIAVIATNSTFRRHC